MATKKQTTKKVDKVGDEGKRISKLEKELESVKEVVSKLKLQFGV